MHASHAIREHVHVASAGPPTGDIGMLVEPEPEPEPALVKEDGPMLSSDGLVVAGSGSMGTFAVANGVRGGTPNGNSGHGHASAGGGGAADATGGGGEKRLGKSSGRNSGRREKPKPATPQVDSGGWLGIRRLLATQEKAKSDGEGQARGGHKEDAVRPEGKEALDTHSVLQQRLSDLHGMVVDTVRWEKKKDRRAEARDERKSTFRSASLVRPRCDLFSPAQTGL